MKDGGFNTLRVEGGPAPVLLLDLAAELGLLVFQEVCPPDRVARTSDWEGMVESLAARDRNQPALVAWCGLRAPRLGRAQENCSVNELRVLDPSRLILCDAPGDLTQALLRPYRDVAEPFESLETNMDAPVNAIARDYLRLCGDPERLNYQGAISVGGVVQWNDGTAAGAARDEAFAEGFAQRQVERCFGTIEKYVEAAQNLQNDALRAQLDAVRCNVKRLRRSHALRWTRFDPFRPGRSEAPCKTRPEGPEAGAAGSAAGRPYVQDKSGPPRRSQRNHPADQ